MCYNLNKANAILRITRNIAFCLLTTNAVAQNTLTTMEELGYKLDPTLEREGAWSKNGDNTVAYMQESTVYGYKQLLDAWSKLKVELDQKYGEGERVRNEVQACSYCGPASDYSNWHTSIQAGSAWLDVAHGYDAIQARLVLKATNKGYFLLFLGR
jgi:hypothetical protein